MLGDKHTAEALARFENDVVQTCAPARRFSSSVNAAESPEMPPPMIAIRFMKESSNASGLGHIGQSGRNSGEPFSDSARHSRMSSPSANSLNPMSMS